MLDAWQSKQLEKRLGSAGSTDESDLLQDPFLKGADSPALERYRLAQARIREHHLAELEGQIIKRDNLRPALLQIASVLRRAGEMLMKHHGREAAAVLEDALDQAETNMQSLVAQLHEHHDENQDPKQDSKEATPPDGDNDHHNSKGRQPARAGTAKHAARGKSTKAAKHARVRRKRNRPA